MSPNAGSILRTVAIVEAGARTGIDAQNARVRRDDPSEPHPDARTVGVPPDAVRVGMDLQCEGQ